MNYLEIDEALVSIVKKMCEECRTRLSTIPKDNATERKALQLELGIYTFCGNAGLLFNTGWSRETVLDKRRHFVEREIIKYPRLNEVYSALNETDKQTFIAACQAELFLRDQWLEVQRKELPVAETAGDVDDVFVCRVKLGAMENVFMAWETWREENGAYPHMFKEVSK